MKLTKRTKFILICICFTLSIFGFMLKLPSIFRHFDKELHSAFYFIAAAFLNIIFGNKKLLRHILIFTILFLFGIAIELAQGYSNKFFHKKIHGRFDPQDIQSNLKGLIAFSILWIVFLVLEVVYKRWNTKN